MTGHKKIVGLWRDSAANQEADCAAPAEAVAPETLAAPEVAAPAERDWLDMSSLNEAEDADVAVPAWRDRTLPALLVLLAIGWTSFAFAVATGGFARAPALADWPLLIATIAMPLTLLAVLWMVLPRHIGKGSGRGRRV